MRSYERDHFRSLKGFSDWSASLFTWTTANWVSAARIVLALPTLAAFLRHAYVAGAILFTIAACADFVDGALARYQERRSGRPAPLDRAQERGMSFLARMNWRGATILGKFMDPLADKICYLTALFPLGWGLLDRRLIWTSLALAAALTVLRPVLYRLFGHEGAANRFGKYKMWCEMIVIAEIGFRTLGATDQGFAIAFTGLGLLLAAISLFERRVVWKIALAVLLLGQAHLRLVHPAVVTLLLAAAVILASCSLAGQIVSAARGKPKTAP